MAKKKKPRRTSKASPQSKALAVAENAILKLAIREHTTPEHIRKHIQIGLINGLVSSNPAVRDAFSQIPSTGDIPSAEEVIAYCAQKYEKNR